jgi:hypothetical protein
MLINDNPPESLMYGELYLLADRILLIERLMDLNFLYGLIEITLWIYFDRTKKK